MLLAKLLLHFHDVVVLVKHGSLISADRRHRASILPPLEVSPCRNFLIKLV